MQNIGGRIAEDQHTFEFPGVGNLIATKEGGIYLRIDFVPDLTPECPETAGWPTEPSLIATVLLDYMMAERRTPKTEDYKVGPVVLVEDGTGVDVAAYAYIPEPGRVEVYADGLDRILTVKDSRPHRVNSAGEIEYD